MSYLVAAVGAVLAAILETSVLPEIRIAGASIDLVLVLTLVSGAVLGFEEGVIWAFVGGFMLDMLTPGDRPIGLTTLTLLLVAGIGALIARVTQPPRLATVVTTVFALSLLYQALLLVLFAVIAGTGIVSLSVATILVIAVLDALLAGVVMRILQAFENRFGAQERVDF